MNGKTVGFIYKLTRRPKRLQNNVFVLYASERIRIQPGEVKKINMKLKLRLPSELVGYSRPESTCRLTVVFNDRNFQQKHELYFPT